MKEIRFHGRGGQGAVTAARMLAIACVREGKFVGSFPMYGFERRGAPVVAFTRFDDKTIREKNQIYNPDCLVVVDPTLITLPTLFTGLQPQGTLILNGPKMFANQPNANLKTAGIVDATKIAVEEVGRDVPNTCLLGAFAAVTGWVRLESVKKSVAEYFSGEVLKKNLRCVERGYNEVKVTKWQ